MTIEEIERKCKIYNIRNYTINDGVVDVDDDVIISKTGIKKFPVRFGEVTGTFRCIGNNLLTLEGAPHTVGGHFSCSENKLTSLEGGPHTVGGHFYCRKNRLITLEGAPKKIDGDFVCSFNQLTSLEGCPSDVVSFDCSDNKLTSLEYCPTEVGTRLYCVGNKITNLDYLPDSLGRIFCCDDNPIGSIFDRVDMEFLYVFNTYKVIKGDQVNLKRLKYVMGLFDKRIDLDEIEIHYTIV